MRESSVLLFVGILACMPGVALAKKQDEAVTFGTLAQMVATGDMRVEVLSGMSGLEVDDADLLAVVAEMRASAHEMSGAWVGMMTKTCGKFRKRGSGREAFFAEKIDRHSLKIYQRRHKQALASFTASQKEVLDSLIDGIKYDHSHTWVSDAENSADAVSQLCQQFEERINE